MKTCTLIQLYFLTFTRITEFMSTKELNPKLALNKAFLKIKPNRTEIEIFKSNLITLLDKLKTVEDRPKDESEEHLKNDIRDFLRDTFYKDRNAINTKDKKAPDTYFSEILEQCHGGALKYGGISSLEELHQNLQANCVPESIFTTSIDHYDEFLKERRKLMAEKMREYYFGL